MARDGEALTDGSLGLWRREAAGRMPAPPVVRAFCPRPIAVHVLSRMNTNEPHIPGPVGMSEPPVLEKRGGGQNASATGGPGILPETKEAPRIFRIR